MLLLTSGGTDTHALFPHMVKLLASSDMLIKKHACWFVLQHKDEQELILLAINSLVKDCEDPNPMVRGLALRVLSSLPQPSLSDNIIPPVIRALKDISPYVRRVAATACSKIFCLNQEIAESNGVIDKLYEQIRDVDPIVVVNCLNSLEEILEPEGGVVINKNIAYYLLNRHDTFTEWGLVLVIQLLKKYSPKTDDEILHIMNILDNLLTHNNASLVLVTLEYFLHLIKNMAHLKNEVYRRCKSKLFHLLRQDNPERSCLLLDHIETMLLDSHEIIGDSYHFLFCKYNEPAYVKSKKIRLLPSVTTTTNIKEILEELGMYAMDINQEAGKAAVEAIAKLGDAFPDHFLTCLEKLLCLLDVQLEWVAGEVLNVLQCLDLKQHCCQQQVMDHIIRNASVFTTQETRRIVVWFIGEYGDSVEDSPYVLESMIDDENENVESGVQLALLTATIKLFIKRPAECQNLLSHVFDLSLQSKNFDVRERASFYYNVLQSGIQVAKSVILDDVTLV